MVVTEPTAADECTATDAVMAGPADVAAVAALDLLTCETVTGADVECGADVDVCGAAVGVSMSVVVEAGLVVPLTHSARRRYDTQNSLSTVDVPTGNVWQISVLMLKKPQPESLEQMVAHSSTVSPVCLAILLLFSDTAHLDCLRSVYPELLLGH